MTYSNPQYIELNQRVDDLLRLIHSSIMDVNNEDYDPDAYAQTADDLAAVENARDDLLADLLMADYNRNPIYKLTRDRALELARGANERRNARILATLAAPTI